MAISSQPSTALFHHRHSFHSGRSLHGRMLPSWTSCRAQKKERGFMDQILDYIEGGPKLRKWYGAPDLLPIDGGSEDEQDLDLETEEPRDAILVTDGDSEIGQMVILALIVNRARVKALVRDKQAAVEAFGSYVELAAYEGSSGLQALVNANAKKLAAKDEEAVVSSGIPYTIIRAALLEDTPGGSQGFSFKQGVAASGRLSKEDAAYICVEALDIIPPSGLVFEVANGEEKVSDWKEWFALRIPGQER
ncbi:NAD(P)-binding Rossmann-fold superfamily protein isoform X2 [Wolffia australiana]